MRPKKLLAIVLVIILALIAIAKSTGAQHATGITVTDVGNGRYYLEICQEHGRRADPVEIGKRVAELELEHHVRFSMAPYEKGGRYCGYFLSPVSPVLSISPATAGD